MAECRESAAPLARAAQALRRLGLALREFLIGAGGTDAYGNYLAHLRRHHPEQTPVSREAFAIHELSARWNGIRRCC